MYRVLISLSLSFSLSLSLSRFRFRSLAFSLRSLALSLSLLLSRSLFCGGMVWRGALMYALARTRSRAGCKDRSGSNRGDTLCLQPLRTSVILRACEEEVQGLFKANAVVDECNEAHSTVRVGHVGAHVR